MLASRAPSRLRQALPYLLLALVLAGVMTLTRGARLQRADLVINNGTEVTTLDPATVTGVPEGRVIKSIFEGLCSKHPATLAPVPGMAQSWQISPDGLTYTFSIRRGARWSNADPVTAHDFVYSWERFLNPETAAEYAYQLWYVKGARAYTTTADEEGRPALSFDTVGIRAPDDHTLVVELEAPTPFFMDLMAFYPLFPVNRRNIESAKSEHPDSWRLEWLRPENIVTNGPFRVVERRVNDRIRLERNPDYWDADNVALSSIDVLAVEQTVTALNMYLTGGVDVLYTVPASVIPRLLPREDFTPGPYLGTYYYKVNVTRPPMNDVRVRRALALTIDRTAICQKITKSGQIPSWTWVPPNIPGYEGAAMEHAATLAENVKEAKRLLVEAGFGPDGQDFPTIEILYNTSEAHRDIAEVIASSWRNNLGIDAKLLNQEWKVYLDVQHNLGFDVCRAAWIGDYVDPNTFADMFVTGGENNNTGWGSPRYDELIAAAAVELDPARRMATLRAAEEILMEEMPILPIYTYVTQNLLNPRLGGFLPNIQDEHFPKYWYWKSDEELNAERAAHPDRGQLVDAPGPAAGLYSPAAQRAGAAR
ncbi:MAG: peptide ABC transporter substrate-binding protein [Planctomycetota bacterium]|jgi:oligopeptide transport system substrate-binding protein|nr:peptide ABC transporter substrate-binding protein [Planctomycetota bacterium]MDP6839134.1 peptide ABC transporter substrate-binding protein [Planctomycetota bacterium]